MQVIKKYTYLGTNGTITSPVHLENIYSIVKYYIYPENGYKLTKDYINFFDYKIVCEQDELNQWKEVKEDKNN